MRAYSITSAPRTWARCAVSGAAGRADPERGLGSGARLHRLASSPFGALPPPSPRSDPRGRGEGGFGSAAPDRSAPRTRAPVAAICAKPYPYFAQFRWFLIFGGRNCAKHGFCAIRAGVGGAARGTSLVHCSGDARALHGLRTAPLEKVGQGRSSAHSAPALPMLCRWVFFPVVKI